MANATVPTHAPSKEGANTGSNAYRNQILATDSR
jgi:hypothetical protein